MESFVGFCKQTKLTFTDLVTEILNRQKFRRLPGREISISSSEEEDSDNGEDINEIAAKIEVVEDPTKKLPQPRKSSLIVPSIARSISYNSGQISDKSAKFQLDEDPQNLKATRKRSVSFLSLAIDEQPNDEVRVDLKVTNPFP